MSRPTQAHPINNRSTNSRTGNRSPQARWIALLVALLLGLFAPSAVNVARGEEVQWKALTGILDYGVTPV